MRHEESTVTSDGQPLFAQRWLPNGEPKAVVVIVHGYAEHSGRYDHVGRALVERGYAVDAFDLRGHGKSPGPRAYVRSADEYQHDLKAVLVDVRRRYSTRPLFLLGHSMGGGIAALYVVREQPDLDGVILSGATIRGRRRTPRLVIWLFRLIARFFPRLRLGKLNAGDVSRDPAVVAVYDSDPLVYRGGMAAGTLVAMIKAGQELNSQLERFALPVLLIHGTEDALTDPEGSKLLYDRASTNDKELKLYQGLYHEVLNEPEQHQVLDDVIRWLDAHVESRRMVAEELESAS